MSPVCSGAGSTVWDSQNRLLQSVFGGYRSIFTYGADGLRRYAEVRDATTNDLISSTSYVLDGQNVVQEWSGQQLAATYLPGLLGPACRIDEVTDAGLWFLYDAHGNVLGEVDEQGRVNYGLSPYDLSQNPVPSPHETPLRAFDAWGFVNNRDYVAVSLNPLLYCGSLGHPTEDATGLIYMRARYYDPLLGRFISEDPARDGGNWYAYAGGNPIGMVDREGRFASLADITVGSFLSNSLRAGFAGGATGVAGQWFMDAYAGIHSPAHVYAAAFVLGFGLANIGSAWNLGGAIGEASVAAAAKPAGVQTVGFYIASHFAAIEIALSAAVGGITHEGVSLLERL